MTSRKRTRQCPSALLHRHNTATHTLINLLLQRWPDRAWVHTRVDQLLTGYDALAAAWSEEVEL